MSFFALLVIALALSLDAMTVALAAGLRMRCTLRLMLRMAFAFGFFQFLMPVLGWFLGLSALRRIETMDHWVAFALLCLIGGKMIRDAWKGKEEEHGDPSRGWMLLALALATSLDALAVGVSLSVLEVNIWYAAGVIGAVCFTLTACALRLGGLAPRGGAWNKAAGCLGGLALMAIGVKILLDHGVFSAV